MNEDERMTKTLCDKLVVDGGIHCTLPLDEHCRYALLIPDAERGDRYMCRYVMRVLEAYSGVDIIGKEDHIPIAKRAI